MNSSKIILIFALLGLAMSGGVHRVAQSRWNNPSKSHATQLSLFFALDNTLPSSGYLWIGIPSGSGFVADSSATAWTLGTSFTAPTTAEITCSVGAADSGVQRATCSKDLAANTAYGLTLTLKSGSTLAAGSHGPVTIETRMNNVASSHGPILDTNNAFDVIAVAADPSAIVLNAAQITDEGYTKKEYPSETATVEFVITFADTDAWPATRKIPAGWNLVFTMKTNAASNRVQGASGTWVKDPVTYEDWTWGATCTNTLWGALPADGATAVTLTNAKPACTSVNDKTANVMRLTIPIAQELTSTDYSTLNIKFRMDVKLPGNLLEVNTDFLAYFYDSANYEVLAISGKKSLLKATKPKGDAVTGNEAKGVVAFNVDPTAPTEITKGVGIYSPPFCLMDLKTSTTKIPDGSTTNASTLPGYYSDTGRSNCGFANALGETFADATTNGRLLEMEIVNSVQITWSLPYAIPDDRTEAVITCNTQVTTTGADTDAKAYGQDPLRIFQSSMMTKGFGKGNCFYEGVASKDAAVMGKHVFRCRSMGALASGASLELGFQFAITNYGKGYTKADNADGKNVVVPLAENVQCTLVISTVKADDVTVSNVEWFKQQWKANVDGGANVVKWSTFIGAPAAFPSLGQKGNAAAFTAGKTADIEMWLFLSDVDRGTGTNNMRLMPWDPTGVADSNSRKTNKFLATRCYGAGLLTAAKFTAAVPDLFSKTNDANLKGDITFAFAGTLTNANLDQTDTAAGYLVHKMAAEAWGGSCCTDAANCGSDKCDKGSGYNLLPFADAELKIAHSYYTSATEITSGQEANHNGKLQHNALMQVKFSGAMTFSETTLSAVRGKGGFGTTQTLNDVFFQMQMEGSSNALQTLMHFYVDPKTAAAESSFNVVYGYPSNVYTKTAGGNKQAANTGAYAVSTGMKLFFTKATKCIADYYGFYVPRMMPFYTSNGGNEIQTVSSNSGRAVKCWNWGSYNGAGFAQTRTQAQASWGLYFKTNGGTHYPVRQYAGVNLIICQVTTTVTAQDVEGYRGDAVVIPALQRAADNTLTDQAIKYKSHNPLPGVASTNPHPSTLVGLVTAEDSTNTNESGALVGKMTILGGSDQYLGTLTHIASTLSTSFKAVAQSDDAIEGSGTALPIPLSFTDAQKNDNGSNGKWDILQHTGTVAENWLIGGKAVVAKIHIKTTAKMDWSTARGQVVVCGRQGGIMSALATAEMRGDSATGEMCTAQFQYTVGADDENVVTGYGTASNNRWCRWCSAATLIDDGDNDHVFLYVKEFAPPTTGNRKLSQLTIWGAADDGKQYITVDENPSVTKQDSVAVGKGNCGATDQTMLLDTLGQVATFSIANSIPLAGGQVVAWGSTGTETFNLISDGIKNGATRCTCGSYSWNTNLFALQSTSKKMTLTLPSATTEAVSEVVCAAGTLSCVVRNWGATATGVDPMTASCWACEKGVSSLDNNCVYGTPGDHVLKYNSEETFTFNQKGTKGTTLIKVVDQAHQPNSKGSMGRFFFRPSMTGSPGQKMYAGQSVMDFTLGDYTFGNANARCQVFANANGVPNLSTPYTGVKECSVAGAKVTITMGVDASSLPAFFVQLSSINILPASFSTAHINGNLNQFAGLAVKADADTAKRAQMDATGNTPATTLKVTVTRTLNNPMDIGMVNFAVTSGYDVTSAQVMLVTWPNYFNPNVGMVRCELYGTNAPVEQLHCRMLWDHMMLIEGPAATQVNSTAFNVRVYGVQMVGSAGANFGFGVANRTNWDSSSQLLEFVAAADIGTAGKWEAKLPIDVTSVSLSGSNLRSTTDITMEFKLPAAYGTTMADNDMVSIQLPWQWRSRNSAMGVPGWMDASSAPSMTVSSLTTSGQTVTAAEMKGAVVQYAGDYVVFQVNKTLNAKASEQAFAAAGNYRISMSSVPTCEGSSGAATMMLGSMVVSVGSMAAGGQAWSSAPLFNALGAMTAAGGRNLLEFNTGVVSLQRGTYKPNAICIQPASGNFRAAVSASVNGAVFKTSPATLSAAMGSAKSCGAMGTTSATAIGTHMVSWTVGNGTAQYTGLPTLRATVTGGQADVITPTSVNCAMGGASVPIVVGVSALPFTDIKVSIVAHSTTSGNVTTDHSKGFTPNTNVATITVTQPEGTLGFTCAANLNDTTKNGQLKFKLDGADKAVYKLADNGNGVGVFATSAIKVGDKPDSTGIKLGLTMVTASSEASSVTLEGTCPGLGSAWIQMIPAALPSTLLTSAADVRAAAAKFTRNANIRQHAETQWCYQALTDEKQKGKVKTTCAFDAASNAKFNANMYCETIEGWFYPDAAMKATPYNFTAPDNGGKPVTMTLTYGKPIDVVADNALVLSITKGIAETLAVPYSRVTDEYGGYHGNPSPSLPGAKPAPKPAAGNTTAPAANATNATANKTRMLANATNASNATNATNASTPAKPAAKTSWTVAITVQPDPFAKTVKNQDMENTLKGGDVLKAVNKVTGKAYGDLSAANLTAQTVVEAAIAFKTAPTATSGDLKITIGGATDVAGFVYCGVAKSPSARRMLNATSNATNATANKTAATPAKTAVVVTLQSAETAAKYTIIRQTMKADALTFSMAFTGLQAGKTYAWMCEATSLSPTNPQFRTAMVKGSQATNAAPAPSGDSALWSSLFAAILMIAAVFFY